MALPLYDEHGDRIKDDVIHGSAEYQQACMDFMFKIFEISSSNFVFVYGKSNREAFIDKYQLNISRSAKDPARVAIEGKVVFFLPHPECIMRWLTATVLAKVLAFLIEVRQEFLKKLAVQAQRKTADELSDDGDSDSEDSDSEDSDKENTDAVFDDNSLAIDTSVLERRIQSMAKHKHKHRLDDNENPVAITPDDRKLLREFEFGVSLHYTTIRCVGYERLHELARIHADDNDDYAGFLAAIRAEVKATGSEKRNKRKRAKRAAMSPTSKKKLNEKANKQQNDRRAALSPTSKKELNEKANKKRSDKLAAMSPDSKEKLKAAQNEVERKKYAAMTPERKKRKKESWKKQDRRKQCERYRDGVQELMDSYEEHGMTRELALWLGKKVVQYLINRRIVYMAHGKTLKDWQKPEAQKTTIDWLFGKMNGELLTGTDCGPLMWPQSSDGKGKADLAAKIKNRALL